MNFTVEIGYPTKTVRLVGLIWLVLTLFICLLLMLQGWWLQAVIAFFILFVGYCFQLRQFKQLYQRELSLQFYQKQWYLLKNEQKSLIEIQPSSRLLSHWILLKYRVDKQPQSLIIFRDAVTDDNYRHISRHLKFAQLD